METQNTGAGRAALCPVVGNIWYILKRIWQWNKAILLLLGLQIPLKVLFAFTGILLPKAVIDCLTKGVSPERLIMTVALFTAALAVFNVGDKLIDGKKLTVAQIMRFNFSYDVLNKVMDTDYENLESPSGQKKLQRSFNFVYDNSSGGEAGIQSLGALGVNIAGLALYGFVLVSLSPAAAFILTFISVVNFLTGRAVHMYEFKRKDEAAVLEQKLSYINKKANEPESAKDARVYCISGWFTRLYGLFIGARLVISGQIELRRFLAQLLAALMYFLRDGLAYGYLIWLVLERRISAADFALYLGAVAGFTTWMDGIFGSLRELGRISLECADYRAYIDMPDNMNRGSGKAGPGQLELPPELIFENVRFRYPQAEQDTIKGIDLHIKKGESIAMVGLNGAGKTTIVKLLTGLYRPSSGRILINGIDISSFNRDEYYDLFSVVFQEFLIMPTTITKNIALRPEEETDREKAVDALRSAGLWEKVVSLPEGMASKMRKDLNDDAVEFSGGELQKLILARALYKNAPFIVLDEPTAALDPIAESMLYSMYSDLTGGRTSLYISHRLASTRFCDRILFVEDGRIAESGTHEELMGKGGKYAELYEIQSHYYKDSDMVKAGESDGI